MVSDLFSKRQQKARGELPDVYQYNEIPVTLRVQIVHIIATSTNADHSSNAAAIKAFKFIHDTLCREYGVFSLSKKRGYYSQVTDFFLSVNDTEKALDVIELCFRIIDKLVRNHLYEYQKPSQKPDDAIRELNQRFKEHGVGFQYEQGSIIRIDNELLHTEVVQPLLGAMNAEPFLPALQEFHSAHSHYRHQRYKECLNDCLKAFESTIKAICEKRGWEFADTATAKTLVQLLFDNSFFPPYLQTQLSAFRTLLESGTPTIRNKNSGHGQGTIVTEVSEALASYCIHLTATNLLFIVSKA